MKKYLQPIIEIKIVKSSDLLCMSIDVNKLMGEIQDENIQFGTLKDSF